MWWIQFHVNGTPHREPTGTKDEKEAKRILRDRLKDVYGQRFVAHREARLIVDDFLDDLLVHLETKGAKGVRNVRSQLKQVRAELGLLRAVDLTSSRIERYIQKRQLAGKANATINREVGSLIQALSLARKQGRLVLVPYVGRLREDNARQGFFDRSDFEALASHLPGYLADIARFAYLTGWRLGEILGVTWNAVDREGGEIRLYTSKNGAGRVVPLEGELAGLIEKRWTEREFTSKAGATRISDRVFHWRGRPVHKITRPWREACLKAGLTGRLFHDFRRTAARDMIRAGIPQSVAMSITGHRTISMFLRYNITSVEDMRQAIRRTADHRLAQSKDRKVLAFPASR
jgi:integrase